MVEGFLSVAAEAGVEAGGEAVGGGAATKLESALAQRNPLVARNLKSTIDELLQEDGEAGKGAAAAPDIALPDGVSLEDYATLAVRARGPGAVPEPSRSRPPSPASGRPRAFGPARRRPLSLSRPLLLSHPPAWGRPSLESGPPNQSRLPARPSGAIRPMDEAGSRRRTCA